MSEHKMSPEQARTFEDGYSLKSIAILAAASETRGCSCEPYVDWFTYARWQAQGFQVQRGEKGTHLPPKFIAVEKEQADGTIKRVTYPKSPVVFCRCQVKPK